jgi:hypothetical protein
MLVRADIETYAAVRVPAWHAASRAIRRQPGTYRCRPANFQRAVVHPANFSRRDAGSAASEANTPARHADRAWLPPPDTGDAALRHVLGELTHRMATTRRRGSDEAVTLNNFDGDVPLDKMVLQGLQVTGGVHYHFATPEPVAPHQLPPLPRRWRPAALGFNDEHQQLTSLVNSGTRLAVLTGPARIGKTLIGLRWAHAHCEWWPDGQFWGDLAPDESGTPAESSDILAHWLEALGVAGDDIPHSAAARGTEWRSRTFGKRVLLFLDDADSEAQVRDLLPNSPNAFTIVTSRTHLAMLTWRGAGFVAVGPRRWDEQ